VWFLFSYCLASVLVLIIYSWLDLGRNKLEDDAWYDTHPFTLGKVFARTNFKFLENVIKVKDNDKSHVEALTDYQKENQLPHHPRDWVCPKVFVLFPDQNNDEEHKFSGYIRDILKKGKSDGFCVKYEELEATYEMGNQRRTKTLNVIKLKDRDAGRNLYAVIAENRPLVTIQRMTNVDCGFQFSRESCEKQSKSYVETLRAQIEADRLCDGKVEIIQFNENQNLSEIFIQHLRRLEQEDRCVT